jgi:hypothetical protein
MVVTSFAAEIVYCYEALGIRAVLYCRPLLALEDRLLHRFSLVRAGRLLSALDACKRLNLRKRSALLQGIKHDQRAGSNGL